MDLSKFLHGFVKVEEMLHATQRNVVTGGGCDCDKAIYGKIMFDHIAIINIAVVLILILKIKITKIITHKIMTRITLKKKTIIIIIFGIQFKSLSPSPSLSSNKDKIQLIFRDMKDRNGE